MKPSPRLAPIAFLLAAAAAAHATNYYVAPSGNDTNSGQSQSAPWKTFSKALSVLRAGDTLYLMDGTYYQRFVTNGASGTATAPIKVLALNDGRAIIDGDTNGDGVPDLVTPLLGLNDSYWDVEGIIVRNSGRDCYSSGQLCYTVGNAIEYNGSHNIMRRVSAYDASTDVNSILIAFYGADNVAEDCVAAGSGRKMIYFWGANAQRNTVRRCFAAWQEWRGTEFDPGVWPWGETIEGYNSGYNLVENAIAYGMAMGPTAGIGFFTQSANIPATGNYALGSMSVKIGQKWDGGAINWPCPSPYYSPAPQCTPQGYGAKWGQAFDLGNWGQNTHDNYFQDIFAYGNAGWGFGADLSTGATNTLIRATMLKNGNKWGGGPSMDSASRGFFSTWSDNYVEGVDTTGKGARLSYRYQSTWNSNNTLNITLTSTPLWPWPMNDRIKSEFNTYIYPKYGATNAVPQNFDLTAAMQSIFNSVPSAVNPLGAGSTADTQAPSVPAGLSAVAISASQVNLTWAASTDNVGVMGYRIYRSGSLINTSSATSYSDSGLAGSTAYTYAVAAYDAAGNVSSQSIPATATTGVAFDTLPPTVSLTSPTAGAALTGAVAISANATDNVAVAGVQFMLDGSNIGSEDTSAPYSLSFDTKTVPDGSHVLTAVARDAAGNTAKSSAVSIIIKNSTTSGSPGAGTLGIDSITDNSAGYLNSQVPKFSKFEITFQVTGSVATNPQLPYDANPPAGIDPSQYPMQNGISVDAIFTPDDWQTTYSQPAFYYETFDDQVKTSWDGQSHEWHLPTGVFSWKVRFSPSTPGNWQYKIVARDASGTAQSPPMSFAVANSSSKGFLKVSPNDPRYFEFDDGTPFYAAGINAGAGLDDPVLGNDAEFQALSQNRVNLLRIWVSALYGSAWLEWIGGSNTYDGYLPRAGLEPFLNPATGKTQMTQVLKYTNPMGWYDACRFQFWNDPEAIKRNTTYKLSIRYYGTNIAGPRVTNGPYGVVGKISNGWHTNCEEPGTGTVVTNYGSNTSDFAVIEGQWNSGNNDFLPRIYLALENATAGKAYIDSVSLREVLPNGQYGPEIITESSMQYDLYFPEESSYSMDKLVGLAEKYGLYLKLVLSEKNDSIFFKQDDDGTYVIGGEADNPDGFYGLGRTINKTRWLQQAWWRYVQARWGYSPSVHSWELTNEGDPYLTTHWQMTDEFGKFMKCRVFGISVGAADGDLCASNHPNRHMTTTSFWTDFPGYSASTGQGFWGSPAYRNPDYADVHAYISTSPAPLADRTLMQDDSAYYHLWHSTQYGSWKLKMPVVRGEAGMDLANEHATTVPGLQSDTQGAWYHDYVWSSLDGGGLYEAYWWYNPDIENPGVYDHRHHALAVANFLSGLPLSNGHYKAISPAVSDSNLRVAGQQDTYNGNAHLWIQNKNHTWRNLLNGVAITPITGTVTLSGFTPNQKFTATWWDTYQSAGTILATTSVTSTGAGDLTLPVQSLSSDIAVKIAPAGGSTPVNQAPTVNAGSDMSIVAGASAALNGAATDDGLPIGALTTTWSKVSGPGTVTFANTSAKATTATFSATGSYVLRLTASDSVLSSTDDCVITVTAAADTTPPTISAVGATSLPALAETIAWNTDELADGQVEYGQTTSYGSSSAIDAAMSLNHSVTLSGLTSAATYHYRVKSRDASGNLAVSGDYTFTVPLSGSSESSTWSMVSPANRPDGRWAGKLVYNSARNTTILYGGDGGSDYVNPLADMWEYDGSNWSQLCTLCTPGKRVGHALVYDSVRDRLVLFGGWNGGSYLNDIWEWDGSTWTQKTPSGSAPSGRRGVYATYDVSRARTVIFGGSSNSGALLDDVYEYDGVAWYGPFSPDTRPPARADAGGPAAFDTSLNRTLVYGGNESSPLDDMWAWNGATWSLVCASCSGAPRSGAAVAFDESGARLLVANGWTGSAELTGSGHLKGGVWEAISATVPPGRDHAGMAYNAATSGAIMFGGNGPACGGNCDETWVLLGQAPVQVAPPAPDLKTPADGATGVSLTTSLTWGASTGATSYDVYFGAGSAPALVANTTATTFSPSGLQSGVAYSWRIVAKNQAGSASSATRTFTTQAPSLGAVVLVSPADAATGVSTRTSITWKSVAGASSYDVYFGTTAAPALTANTTKTSYSPGALLNSTVYYWRVVAKNTNGSVSSEVRSFTTAAKGKKKP